MFRMTAGLKIAAKKKYRIIKDFYKLIPINGIKESLEKSTFSISITHYYNYFVYIVTGYFHIISLVKYTTLLDEKCYQRSAI